MKWMKKNWSTFLLLVILITGIVLLIYPTFGDYWNAKHQSKAIINYVENISDIDEELYEKVWEDAVAYNKELSEKESNWIFSDEEKEYYNEHLNVDESGVMAVIDIPAIDCSLPIYHGTSSEVLQSAIGHIEGSSLPVGGESTHCVLSGHRGLPSAKLFTDLDKLVIGDIFTINTLDVTLTYQVDQIRIVEPTDFSELEIEEGKDYCTLVTCSPYGINTHRLLVRGHRIANEEEKEEIRVNADATLRDPIEMAPFFAIPMIFVWLLGIFIGDRRR